MERTVSKRDFREKQTHWNHPQKEGKCAVRDNMENGILSRNGCSFSSDTEKGTKILSKCNKARTMKQKK